MRRIILSRPLVAGRDLQLSAEERHYLVDVLRLRPGDEFLGLDGEGRAFAVQLRSSAGRCLVLGAAAEAVGEPRLEAILCLPLLKGNRLDLVVQKSVELGVSTIAFFAAQRAIVKGGNWEAKMLRWQKIAKQAARQSRRQRVPCLVGLLPLAEAAAMGPGYFAWEQQKQRGLRAALAARAEGKITLLTGPEGGLTRDEASALEGAGWESVSLGPRILRAETAAIALLACTMFAGGELE